MNCRKLQKTVLLLIICSIINTASAQRFFKVGENPFTISNSAVLEVESTTKGFLPPRMSMEQRNAITSPAAGLIVWCNDCNSSTDPKSGQLYVYLGTTWAPVGLPVTFKLTTDKNPIKVSATSATIKGVLRNYFGDPPTETGVVYREITGNDFATLPVLDATETATPPTYKIAGALVTDEGSPISVTIPGLNSTTLNKRPYYFRTYAKGSSGISYGNTIIFNVAPPDISTPTITNENSFSPNFTGTLTVNAGTPPTVTEYGYFSSQTNPPTTNKVVLSTNQSITDLKTQLSAEKFTADPPATALPVKYALRDSDVGNTIYFRYYVIANGETTYSPAVPFTSPAKFIFNNCSIASTGTLTVGTPATGVSQTFTVSVSIKGKYSVSTTANGVTFENSGFFTRTGAQNIVLTATGTPTAAGSPSFALSTLPPSQPSSCSFSRDIISPTSNGTAQVNSYTSNIASTGTLFIGRNITSGLSQTISADVATTGSYNISATANGITFAGSGRFTNTGPQNIVLTATGTPKIIETSNFVLNTTPNYSFDREIVHPSSNGSAIVNSYTCGTSPVGTLAVGTAASGASQSVRVDVAAAGSYNISTTTVNGVTFAGSGNFAKAEPQNIILTATGTPTIGGTPDFVLNTTPNCSFKRRINNLSSNGTAIFSNFNCQTASANTLAAGIPPSGTVTQTITVTIVQEGTYDISATANGVTFANSGAVFAAEKGIPRDIVLTATGTPVVAGTNSFVLNTTPGCSFNRATVSVASGKAICDGSAPTPIEEVHSSTGKIWMARNLGANRVAESVDDYRAYGCLYQWGRGNDGHASTNWTSSTEGLLVNTPMDELASVDNPGKSFIMPPDAFPYDWRSPQKPELWQGVDGINNPCPSGYRVPTAEEFGKEITTYKIKNAADAYNSIFKFPFTGMRDSVSASIIDNNDDDDLRIHLWSSTVQKGKPVSAAFGPRTASGKETTDGGPANGMSVRCIKN